MIRQALFAVVWTTGYPSLLGGSSGRLVTRSGYAPAFEALGGDLRLPWQGEQGEVHWSRFWADYLGKPERMRILTSDAAFDRVIPFQWKHDATVEGPAGTSPEVDVLLYPGAIAVVVRVTVTGEWSLEDLPEALAGIRESRGWSLTMLTGTSEKRSLDGIANDLRDRAVKLITRAPGAPEPGSQEILTVAAPVTGEGNLGSFGLEDETARACLAGLAVLGPPGTLVDKHLLEQNSDSRRPARIYALKSGHAIWHPRRVLHPSERDSIGCLHRNQTDLVAHITALASLVIWAADRLAAPGGIPVELQPLVQRAVERLELLHAAADKTYRSGIAASRIEPLLERLDAVKGAL